MGLRSSAVTIALSAVLAICPVQTAQAEEVADGFSSLEARIKNMEDRVAIQELLVTYGRLLDQKDLAGYSKLFSKDGVWEGGIGSATGPDGIYGMLERVFSRVEPGRYGSDYHLMSDFVITVDGNRASAWSRWTWIVEGEDGKPVAQRSGHYEDTLVREDDQWRFQHRLTVTELPTPEKDGETRIFRRDHRDTD